MMVYCYCGYQYFYLGHCVSFMQNTVKTVDMLPNLLSKLDIVVLQLSNRVMESDPRYQRQFRSDFQVCKGYVLTWLCYLKTNHPDYPYITISLDRLDALLIDGNISSSITSIIDDNIVEEL